MCEHEDHFAGKQAANSNASEAQISLIVFFIA
jgi:hypothetical protein